MSKVNYYFLVDTRESQNLDVKLVDLIIDENQNEDSDFEIDDQSGVAEA